MPRASILVLIAGVLLFAGSILPASYAADDAPAIVFNIKDGDIVKLDDFLLVGEVNEDLRKTYDTFKLLIDGKEMDAKFLTEQGLITFLPGEGFDVGKHLIQLVGIKGDVEEKLNEFGFGAVLKDLDKFISGEKNIEDAILALGGQLIVDADINSLEGVGKDILLRDPREALTQLATKIATDQWGLDIMLLADSQQGRYTQFYDRLKVGYSQDELDVLLGETFPKFSEYTIQGRRLQGVSWGDDLGDTRFEGAWGQALRRIPTQYDTFGSISDPGSPALDVYTVRFGTKEGKPLRAGVTLLGGSESNYGPEYEFTGAENRVLSVDFKYDAGENFYIDGEYASAKNKVEETDSSNDGDAKRVALNYDRGDNKLSLTYRDVEPTFDSFGLNSIRNDVRGIKLDDKFNFGGEFTGGVSYEKYRDDLDNTGIALRWTKSISGRVTYRPDYFPGGLDFTYRKYDRFNNLSPEETGAYDVSTDSMTFSGFVRGEFFDANHQFRVSYTDRSSDNAVHTTSGSDSNDISFIWSARFDSGMGVNASYGKQDRKVDSGSDSNSNRYDVSVTYPMDDGRLVLIAGYGNNTMDTDATGESSDRLNARLALRWKFTPYYYIEASYQRLDYDDGTNSALSYGDDAFKVRLISSY